jgi:hypothetical protein
VFVVIAIRLVVVVVVIFLAGVEQIIPTIATIAIAIAIRIAIAILLLINVDLDLLFGLELLFLLVPTTQQAELFFFLLALLREALLQEDFFLFPLELLLFLFRHEPFLPLFRLDHFHQDLILGTRESNFFPLFGGLVGAKTTAQMRRRGRRIPAVVVPRIPRRCRGSVDVVLVVIHHMLGLCLFRRIPIEGFSALVAYFDPLGTDFTQIGMATGQDHRLSIVQVKLLVADDAMQFHFDSLSVLILILVY